MKKLVSSFLIYLFLCVSPSHAFMNYPSKVFSKKVQVFDNGWEVIYSGSTCFSDMTVSHEKVYGVSRNSPYLLYSTELSDNLSSFVSEGLSSSSYFSVFLTRSSDIVYFVRYDGSNTRLHLKKGASGGWTYRAMDVGKTTAFSNGTDYYYVSPSTVAGWASSMFRSTNGATWSGLVPITSPIGFAKEGAYFYASDYDGSLFRSTTFNGTYSASVTNPVSNTKLTSIHGNGTTGSGLLLGYFSNFSNMTSYIGSTSGTSAWVYRITLPSITGNLSIVGLGNNYLVGYNKVLKKISSASVVDIVGPSTPLLYQKIEEYNGYVYLLGLNVSNINSNPTNCQIYRKSTGSI